MVFTFLFKIFDLNTANEFIQREIRIEGLFSYLHKSIQRSYSKGDKRGTINKEIYQKILYKRNEIKLKLVDEN